MAGYSRQSNHHSKRAESLQSSLRQHFGFLPVDDELTGEKRAAQSIVWEGIADRVFGCVFGSEVILLN
jgi:hypothetical protein